MGLRSDLLKIVLTDLPSSDSVIAYASPRFDELMGGKTAADKWKRFETGFGTNCAVTAVGWLLEAGAPPDMLNAEAPGGSGFTPGAHFTRLNAGASSRGWLKTPTKGQLPDFRPGDIFQINHVTSTGKDGSHMGLVLSVTPSADGQSLSVETADGGQGPQNGQIITRQTRTFSLGNATHPVLVTSKYSSGWLDRWVRVGGDETDDTGAGGAPPGDSGAGGAPSDGGPSSVIPALIITASAFAIFYAVVSGMGIKKRKGGFASSEHTMSFSKGVLHTPSGDIRMKHIGHGTFADVFRENRGDRRVFIFLPHGVPDKDIAEMARRSLPDNPHLPDVKHFGETEDKVVYTMPYYSTPFRKANAGDAWNDYRILYDCLDDMNDSYRYDRKVNAETVKCAKSEGVDPGVVKALAALDKASRKFSSKYAFEFSPRNLGVDKDGNMVLLDVLFDRKLVPWEYQDAPNWARR